MERRKSLGQQTLPHPGDGSDLREHGDRSGGDQRGSEAKCIEGEGGGRELGLVPRCWCSVVAGQVGAGFRGKRTSHCDTC